MIVTRLITTVLFLVVVPFSVKAASLEDRLDQLNKDTSMVEIDRRSLDRKPSRDIQKTVEQIVSLYRSPEYRQKLKQEQRKIRKILRLNGQTDSDEDLGEQTGQSGLPVYVFVSASIPLQTLRNYAAGMTGQTAYAPVMVFRGFIGGAGKIGPTAQLIADIINVDSTCEMSSGQCDTWPVSVTVDPLKFRRFGIEKVPAIVLDRGEKKEPFILYGDVSLTYALNQFNLEVRRSD